MANKVGRKLSDRYSLTKWLSKRNKMSERIRFEVVGDIEKTICPALGLTYEQPRMRDGQPRTREDMAIEAFAFFESKYLLSNGALSSVKRSQNHIMTEMALEMMTLRNSIKVQAPFPFSRYPGDAPLHKVLKGIQDFFKQYDVYLFSRFCGMQISSKWLKDNVFKRSACGQSDGLPWVSTGVETLQVLAGRSASIYNRMFTGDKIGQYTVSSVSGLYPDKYLNLVKKFDTSTRDVGADPRVLGPLLFEGLKLMYDYMDVKKHFGTISWTFDPRDVLDMEIPTQSSAGIRAGTVYSYEDDLGFVHKVTPNGVKGDHLASSKERLMGYIDEFKRTGDIKFIETACCICLKQEIFNSSSMDEEDRKKTYMKCREFFIPHMMQYMIAVLVQGDRQKNERGKMIKVGMRWWHGGAQKFAEQLQYQDPDMVYFDGDFKALDTTIRRYLLELYASQASIYIDEETSPDFKMFMAFLRLATENLSVKLVHIFARVWMLMFGVMPSGAYETSHGNSWIVGLLFFAYLVHVISKNPHRANQILRLLKAGKIQFPVYGDDHNLGVHRSIIDIVNEEGFAAFVNRFCGMLIQKIRSNVPLFSVPNKFGDLEVTGLVFLKRYLIKRPDHYDKRLPDVLPFKKLSDMIVKMAWGNNERATYADYAIASIGLAYDTMGTNDIAYDLAYQLFRFCIVAGKFDTMESLKLAFLDFSVSGKKDLTRTARKCGVSVDTLFSGFPTKQQLLELHILDENYCNFTPEFGRHNAATKKKWRENIYL